MERGHQESSCVLSCNPLQKCNKPHFRSSSFYCLCLSHCSCARFSLIQVRMETLLPFLSHVCLCAVVLATWSSTNTGQSRVRRCWGLPVGQDTRSGRVFPWGPDVLVSVASRLCLACMLTAALCKELLPASLLPVTSNS